MTPRGKINLEAILAGLNTTWTECGYPKPPNEIMRIDFDTMKCSKAPKKGNKNDEMRREWRNYSKLVVFAFYSL